MTVILPDVGVFSDAGGVRLPTERDTSKRDRINFTTLLTNESYIVKIDDIMPRPLVADLSPTHHRILQAIHEILEQGRPASVSDLVADLGLAGPSSLTPTLKIMERNKYVHINTGGKNGRRYFVELTSRAKQALGIAGVPVVGSIPAGPLSEALQDSETIVDLGTTLPYQPGDFLLIVNGRSMIGDGILPGDKVLLRPSVHVQNGEIAAVHVGHEYYATLKHVHFGPKSGSLTLRASNPDYEDIVIAEDATQIAGVFRGLIRSS